MAFEYSEDLLLNSNLPKTPTDWALDLAKIGTWRLDLENEVLNWSEQTYKIHELEPDAPLDLEKAINYYTEESRPIIESAVSNLIENGQEFDLHLQIITEKRNPAWVRAMGRPVTQDGNCVAIEGIFQNTTGLKMLADEINLAHKQQEEYIEVLNSTAIIARTNPQGIITFVNDTFCEISKYERQELLGQDHRILNSGFHPKGFFVDLWKTIASGNEWRGQIKNIAKDGSYYWVDTLIKPISNVKGKITEYLSIRRDITSQKEKEEFDINTTSLLAIGEASAQILHDVMNPLAVIQGAAYNLGRLDADDAMMSKLEPIRSSIDNSVDSIKSIFQGMRSLMLDDVKLKELDLDEMLNDVLAISSTLLRKRNVSVKVERNQLKIIGNRNLLVQVFLNLVKNSVEAMDEIDEKWIRIESVVVGRFTFVRFIDAGSGIPQEVQRHMFDSLYTTKKETGGTGIGLALCAKIMKYHGGELKVNDNNLNTEIDVIFSHETRPS